jgi:hypothetical protein
MKSDFEYLAHVTPAQWGEVRAVINARANIASWDAPMQRAIGAAEPASSKAANAPSNASKDWDRAFRVARGEALEPKAEPGSGWDRAMRRVLSRRSRSATDLG